MMSSKSTQAPRKGLVRSSALPLLASAAVLALAGCKTTEDSTRVAGWTLVDAAQRHPILVSEEPAMHLVRVAPGSKGLTPPQRGQIIGFTNHFRTIDAGNSRLVVSVPSGGANELGVMSAAHEIRDLLRDRGFAEPAISVEAYDAEGASDPPIRIGYLRYVAQPPQCGDWSTNLAHEPMNLPYPNFGCATQRNFGVQVANPADLLGPRSETARSSERRDVVIEKYKQGQPTGTSSSAAA